MRKVLLLGGTGAMGMHLVDILSKSEDLTCVVTTRKHRKGFKNVSYVEGNAHNEDFLKTLFTQKWDAIVDFMSYSTKEFMSKAEGFLTSTDHYIFLSSARVYAKSDAPITEDSPRLLDVCKDPTYLQTDEYALTKARQENCLREIGKNFTIIRPYITFSENRLQLGTQEKEQWLYRALHGRTIVFSEDISKKKTTLTYGYDVAQGIASILWQQNAMGEAFHITADESFQWKEILEKYVEVLKGEKGINTKCHISEKWEPFHGGSFAQANYDRMYDRLFDNKKINEFLKGYKYSPVLATLGKCLKEFLNDPHFLYKKWENEAMKDKLTGELATYSEIEGFKQKIKYSLYRTGLLNNIKK